MFKFARTAVAVTLCAAANSAQAQVIQTFGAGSAINNIHASAFFESQNALTDNPYVENGLEFSRTNLNFNNNTCGYAGCKFVPGLSHFSGNYMYAGGTGYFTMRAPTGKQFAGLEFLLGNGWVDGGTWSVEWSAFLNGVEVGAGTVDEFTFKDIIGFSRTGGFDELRYTDLNNSKGAAFDDVYAEYTSNVAVVPEPSSWMMMCAGLLFVGAMMRRRAVSLPALQNSSAVRSH